MSGSGGFYKYRCKYFYTHNCANWVWVNNTPCATCLVSSSLSLPPFFVYPPRLRRRVVSRPNPRLKKRTATRPMGETLKRAYRARKPGDCLERYTSRASSTEHYTTP